MSAKKVKPAKIIIATVLSFVIPVLFCILAARFSILALSDHMMDKPGIIEGTKQRIEPVGKVKVVADNVSDTSSGTKATGKPL
ncbi:MULTISPECIES: hypothetical protein [Candidatus Ichthyocystis]|uniref:Putative membrane protein n=1 Tax=Candidatus Ichthyocystis hellenicum TaxID=1561003 RepID=A0A0S4M432_9BURK|nr:MULTISPECIES: hypothetical protein [Ichthyocystis]CUT17037.1 putative membrane protein [Candidatus Ichthyocystis hellenicum]